VDTLIANGRTPFAPVCEAIRTARCLELTYAGHRRVVEAHIAGAARDGTALVLAWQVRGGSSSGQPAGWKMFHLDRVAGAQLSAEPSQAPRAGYRRDDRTIVHVVCRV